VGTLPTSSATSSSNSYKLCDLLLGKEPRHSVIAHENSQLRFTLTLALVAVLPICAQSAPCAPVGGVLFTNTAAIDGVYNLGPVFGDLQGSVAAKIVSANPDGTFTLQHYWVTTSGATILMNPGLP
jgi:hypothetical protein